MPAHWLGVDTGGTFTDFVYFDGRVLLTHKVLSTPHAPELAILQGIEELELSFGGLQVIHGSTVATNAVLEARGVKTVYVANCGFADVLSIGRQARRELYNLMPAPLPSLIPPEHCLEINTRLSAQGELLQPLQQSDIDGLIDKIKKINPRAVAVNLLFSFLQNEQELEIKKQLSIACENMFVCCSSDVLAEYKEYERGMATALNAYVGPLMQGYLKRLAENLTESLSGASDCISARLSVMQSSGGTIDVQKAGEHAVNLLLSGPAGGLKAAQYIAALTGVSKLLSFDMGGTSTDVAMINGKIQLTSEGRIGDYPVAVPMVDMHTIGAGGGSIACIDAGGLLNVGPQSAGASPGPACYGGGGTKPTVTDANLILGRLRADAFLLSAGENTSGMLLNIGAARAAMQPIAEQLELSVEAAAEGVIRLANQHMVRALRRISVQRGYDPQAFSLTCLGGAAGLHVCALADALNMRHIIVPVHGGVLSALGMLIVAPSRELSIACIQLLETCESDALEKRFNELEARARAEMEHELKSDPVLQRSVDLRYKGQSFTLNLPLNSCIPDDLYRLQQAFHQRHQETYGHQLNMAVELVNLRLSIEGDAPPFALPLITSEGVSGHVEQVDCYCDGADGLSRKVSVYHREQLVCGEVIAGPALLPEKASTTFIDSGWICEVDRWGNLLLVRL